MSKLTNKYRKAAHVDQFEYRLQDTPAEPQVQANKPVEKYSRVNSSLAMNPTLEGYEQPEGYGEYEEYEQLEFDLPEFVRNTQETPVDDTILERMYFELNDIEAKLAVIDFLKNMEKALRKRAKVLTSFVSKLENARKELNDVGANLLGPLRPSEIDKLKNYLSVDINGQPLDSSVDKQETTNERLKDFEV